MTCTHRELAILIIASLTVPGVFLIVGIVNEKQVLNNPEEVIFTFVNMLLIAGLAAVEMKTITKANPLVKTADEGFLSAILTILALFYFPLLDKYYFKIFAITDHKATFHILGLVVFALGFALRKESAKILGTYFSHELRIVVNQTICSDGVYHYIRHPAYLGTLLLVIGVSWMFLTHIGIFLFVPAFIYVSLRIKTEEEMLARHFGDAYIGYKKDTKKLIPFVF